MSKRQIGRSLLAEDAGEGERADAARNRRRILDAAAELVETRGVAALSFVEVARAAQTGVGTVYRRFSDRSNLLYALLDRQERRFQAAVLTGPPPLGPGAPPAERIRAFLHALVDEVARHRELLVEAETAAPGARYRSGPYAMHRQHLAMLLGQVGRVSDTAYLADALLAPVSAILIDFQHRQQGRSYDSIKAGIDELLHLLPNI